MQAALNFAESGAAVTLFEKEDHLGGQLNAAAMLPGRDDLKDYLTFLRRGLARTKVNIKLGAIVGSLAELDNHTELVVLATGSIPTRRPQEGYPTRDLDISGLRSWSAVDAVEELIQGRHVVVVDETGRYEGLGTCDHLSERGHRVTYVTSLSAAGRSLHATGDYPILMERLIKRGVEVLTEHRVDGHSIEGLILASVYDSANKHIAEEVADVVWISGNEPVVDLDAEPSQTRAEVLAIGDALAPRGLDEAVFDAYRVAGAI